LRCPKKGPNGLIRYWFDAFLRTRTISKPQISEIFDVRTKAESGLLIRPILVDQNCHCARPPCDAYPRQAGMIIVPDDPGPAGPTYIMLCPTKRLRGARIANGDMTLSVNGFTIKSVNNL
jgi:hypothetical protein